MSELLNCPWCGHQPKITKFRKPIGLVARCDTNDCPQFNDSFTVTNWNNQTEVLRLQAEIEKRNKNEKIEAVLMDQAADKILELQAEIARLREELEGLKK